MITTYFYSTPILTPTFTLLLYEDKDLIRNMIK